MKATRLSADLTRREHGVLGSVWRCLVTSETGLKAVGRTSAPDLGNGGGKSGPRCQSPVVPNQAGQISPGAVPLGGNTLEDVSWGDFSWGYGGI